MKKGIGLFAVLIFAISFITAQQEIKIDLSKSVVNWKGSKLFNFSNHFGTVKFKEGTLKMKEDDITGGKFMIDMNTIINTDGGYSEDLVGHLKHEDFFVVEKHPTAELTIHSVGKTQNGLIEFRSDLTIKGITKPIEFYSKLDPNKKSEIRTEFIIDRTDWNLTYGAKSITNYKDGIISDAIEFEVVIVTM